MSFSSRVLVICRQKGDLAPATWKLKTKTKPWIAGDLFKLQSRLASCIPRTWMRLSMRSLARLQHSSHQSSFSLMLRTAPVDVTPVLSESEICLRDPDGESVRTKRADTNAFSNRGLTIPLTMRKRAMPHRGMELSQLTAVVESSFPEGLSNVSLCGTSWFFVDPIVTPTHRRMFLDFLRSNSGVWSGLECVSGTQWSSILLTKSSMLIWFELQVLGRVLLFVRSALASVESLRYEHWHQVGLSLALLYSC